MITVFTPAYNRAHLLPRLFESLCKQTYKDFEWVIVDDGSSDDTKSVVEKFSVIGFELSGDKAQSLNTQHSTLNTDLKTQNSKLKTNTIRYFYQENGGKHRAINRGVKEAKGELFLILDSDDTLPERSLEWIDHYYQQIKNDASFGGVCGYMAHHDGTKIGRGNNDEVLDANSIEMRYKYKIQGDMLEVFRTSVMREIPFPDIPGEKFVPEALVWNRIACKYRLRVFQEVVYYRDYLDGGLTDKIVKIRMMSPIASMMTYAELNSHQIPFVFKVKAAINYWRFRFCSDAKEKPALKWWYHWTMPIGWGMHLKDKRRER
jgi:glycosyltransferase involved in cell wall biosynthesis